MNVLEEFYSVGPELAKKLWSILVGMGYVDPDSTYTHAQMRRVLAKKSVFEILPKSTQTDVMFNPLRKIPRAVIELLERELIKYTHDSNPRIQFDIAGSYKRGRPTSSDIDFVISKGNNSSDTQTNIWDVFTGYINRGKKVHIMEPFAKGDDKITTLFRVDVTELSDHPDVQKLAKDGVVYVKVDAFLAEPGEYLFALLYATGSGRFNVRMRATAKRKGYLLNQKGIFKRAENDMLQKIDVKDEKEIFELLGMRYKTPEKRVQ